jgi:hypothetical protein
LKFILIQLPRLSCERGAWYTWYRVRESKGTGALPPGHETGHFLLVFLVKVLLIHHQTQAAQDAGGLRRSRQPLTVQLSRVVR